MPYRYRDDIATADVAFEAWGETLEAMFLAAADATMNVMVADLETIRPVMHRRLEVTADATDMLLFALLQELIFYKDAEQLLLRVTSLQVSDLNGELRLAGDSYGEILNAAKHDLIVDIKAVTLHRFKVEPTSHGWEALVVLDI